MQNHAKKSAVFGLVLLLAACATPPPPTPSVAVSVDPSALARMKTADAAAVIPSDYPDPAAAQAFLLNDAPIDNPAMVARLQEIVDHLLQNWTATPIPEVAIYILPDNGYNGDASGANQLFVNVGLLERAQSEDEIAFVLAHELAHILLGDVQSRDQGVASNTKLIGMASMGAVEGIMLAHHGEQTLDYAAEGAILAAYQAGQVLMAANQSMGDAGWSRDQEYEADELGLDLMIQSKYYDPEAYIAVFNRLAAEDTTLQARRAALQGTISASLNLAMVYALGNRHGGTTILDSKQTAELIGTVVSSPVVEKALDKILHADTHPPELKRLASLEAYQAKYWPNVLPVNDKPNPFNIGTLGYQTTLITAAINSYNKANQDITNNQLTEVPSLTFTFTMSRELPVEQKLVRAKLALAEGEGAQAQAMLSALIQDPQAPAVTYSLLAGLQAQNGETDAALSTLDAGKARFGSDEDFVTARIGILQNAGRTDDVKTALQECTAYADEDLMDSCEKAAAPPTQIASSSQ